MPHTTRHKHNNSQNNNNKRLQVTDDSGWTHVTTTSRARRLPTSKQKGTQNKKNSHEKNEKETQLRPAEAPATLTLHDLRGQFERHYGRWLASGSWGVVRGGMSGIGTDAGRDRDSDKYADAVKDEIENIICIGLGSPSGFLRGGWVDRRQVSMHQLAALVSMKDLYRQFLFTSNLYIYIHTRLTACRKH